MFCNTQNVHLRGESLLQFSPFAVHIMENLPAILYVINFTSHCRANRLIHRLTSSFPKFYYPDILPGYRFSGEVKTNPISVPALSANHYGFACTLWCDLHSGGISPRLDFLASNLPLLNFVMLGFPSMSNCKLHLYMSTASPHTHKTLCFGLVSCSLRGLHCHSYKVFLGRRPAFSVTWIIDSRVRKAPFLHTWSLNAALMSN